MYLSSVFRAKDLPRRMEQIQATLLSLVLLWIARRSDPDATGLKVSMLLQTSLRRTIAYGCNERSCCLWLLASKDFHGPSAGFGDLDLLKHDVGHLAPCSRLRLLLACSLSRRMLSI